MVRLTKWKRRTEATTNHFTFSADHYSYWKSQVKYVGHFFVEVFVKIAISDLFAEDDMDPLFRQFCTIDASIQV